MEQPSSFSGGDEGSQINNFFDQKVELSLGGRVKVESFEELGLPEHLSKIVEKEGYSKPTPIQQYAMKSIQDGKDLMACSQTGSGKTAAFLLPIMSKLMQESDLSTVSDDTCSPRALILAPTRELAIQIHHAATKFSMGTMCKCEVLYGGTAIEYQKERVLKGAPILIGTIGRLKHFISDGIISLEKVQYLVLDEADRLLDLGCADDINKTLSSGNIAPKTQRQTLMFSATFPPSVQELAKELLRDQYLKIVVDKMGAANKCITQDFVKVAKRSKKSTLLNLIGVDLMKHEQNKDLQIFKQKTLIFVSSKTMADCLGVFLSENNIPTTTIHGDREQEQRESALVDFRSGRTPILIATSVAERGLDISGLDHVINYDMPKEIDDYLHRIGRTGRVGNRGLSTSFIDPEYDGDIVNPLLLLLTEAEQQIPDWLSEMRTDWTEMDVGTGDCGWPSGDSGWPALDGGEWW